MLSHPASQSYTSAIVPPRQERDSREDSRFDPGQISCLVLTRSFDVLIFSLYLLPIILRRRLEEEIF